VNHFERLVRRGQWEVSCNLHIYRRGSGSNSRFFYKIFRSIVYMIKSFARFLEKLIYSGLIICNSKQIILKVHHKGLPIELR
jgi:hypothetical protein